MKQTPARRPVVLQLVTRLVGGAAEEAALLTRSLDAYGFDVHIGTGPERRGEWVLPPERTWMISSLSRNIHPVDDLRSYVSVVRLMRRLQPEIVHTHMSKVGTLGRLAASVSGAPVRIHMFHGHVLRDYFGSPASALARGVERSLARKTDAFVAVSSPDRTELLSLGIGRAGQWRVIPYGLVPDDAGGTELSAPEARAELGVRGAGALVGIVGRLDAIKDHATFLRAAALVAARDAGATFVVAGDGDLRQEIEAEARRVLGDRVVLPGWVSNRAALYGALDIVVLTSRREGTPMSLIEAAGAAKPVVATRVGGVADVVRDGVSGFIVSPGDHPALADRILTLLSDPARRRAMGSSAQRWVRDRYSMGRHLDAIASLYGELMNRRHLVSQPRPDHSDVASEER
jgi:glycosyltransferase involved in cell wall biosynthesis